MEIEIGDQKYAIRKMDAISQFHIARKLAPIIAAMGDTLQVEDDGLKAFVPLAEAIAGLPEDDVNAVIDRCLSVVSRSNGAGWSPVWNGAAKRPMFDDIDMVAMLQLVVAVIKDALGNFTGGPLSGLTVSVK